MNSEDRLEMIREMLAKDPSDSFLHYAAALELHKLGKLQEAIIATEHLLAIDPNYLGAYYRLGKFYEEDGRIEAAIAIYKKGKPLAAKHNDVKTLGEISEALMILDDEDW